MNFKIDDKNYDSEKLSDNGKLYLAKLKNITVKEQNLALEASDLNILRSNILSY